MHQNKIKEIPCIILSGGKSSRMGEDKSLMSFHNTSSMIEYLHAKLETLFETVYISSKTNKFTSLKLTTPKLLLDKNSNISSPMIALESILSTLKEEKVFIITVDTPLIEEKTIEELIENSTDTLITIAKDKDNNIHNLCGVFSKKLLPLIQELLQQDIHKINYLIKESKNYQTILFRNSEQFLNINTKETYEKAKTLLERF